MQIKKIFWLALFIACFICPPVTSAAASTDWQETVRQGDELFAHRCDTDNGRENLKAAIGKYEEALNSIPEDDDRLRAGVYTKLSRCYFTLAEYFTDDDDELSELTDKGQEWAKKAVKADPENAGAHYWLGANLGLWRSVHKVSFRGGLTGGGIKKQFKKAAELDGNCEYGLPYMRLAEFELSTGDPEAALPYAEKAVKIGPKLLTNHIILAEILWENGDRSKARKTLEHIAAQQDDILPTEILENRHVIKKSRRILADLEKNREPDW